MPNHEFWADLMSRWNMLIFNSKIKAQLDVDIITRGWLGHDGSDPKSLQKLESRLSKPLPPSYRSFLEFSDGWDCFLTPFISELWSTENVDWFSTRHSDWIDAWSTYIDYPSHLPSIPDEDYFKYGDEMDELLFRAEYLTTAVEISPEGDSAILLLNPQIVFEDGEWEAWFLANWLPGVYRYRSFRLLMLDAFKNLPSYLGNLDSRL